MLKRAREVKPRADLEPLSFAPELARAVAVLSGTRLREVRDARVLATNAGEPLPVLAPLRRPPVSTHDPSSPLGHYHATIGADLYQILVHKAGSRADRLFQLPPAPIDEVAAAWPVVTALALQGAGVRVEPSSNSMHHVVIRGMTRNSVQRLTDDGYTPALVLTTDDGQFDAVLNAEREAGEEEEAAAEAARLLNAHYGALSTLGYNAGIGFPYSLSLSQRSPGPQCRAFSALATSIRPRHSCGALAAMIRTIVVHIRDTIASFHAVAPAQKLTPYEAHRRDIVRRYGHVSLPDQSRIDVLIAQRLRATGHSPDQITLIIEEIST